jgi:hypothetical protein
MVYRTLTNSELVGVAEAVILAEDSNLVAVNKQMLKELVDRFEKVLSSHPSLLKEGTGSKDPDQLELF